MRRDRHGNAIQVATYSTNAPLTVNLGVSSAVVGPLNGAITYRLWSSVDCFFLPGANNTITANTSSHPLKAGLDTLHLCDPANPYIAAIVPTGTGVLYVSEIDSVS